MARVIAIFLASGILMLSSQALSQQEHRELVCQFVSVTSSNSDISVYRCRRLENESCRTSHPVADENGDTYVLQAIVKSAPNVPLNASCNTVMKAEIKFDIGRNGRTQNVEAISGSPEEWVRRSIKAVKRERYEPYVLDGEAMEIRGITTVYQGELVPAFLIG